MSRSAKELEDWFYEAFRSGLEPKISDAFFRPTLGTNGVWVDLYHGNENVATVVSFDKDLPLETAQTAYDAAKKEYEKWKR